MTSQAPVKLIADALISSKTTSALQELDLSKCHISSESVLPLVKLIESKFRLRTLLLSNNSIYDLSASEIYSALQFNPYLTRLKLDLNPIRNLITRDIDALTLLNSQKVSSQELP